MQKTLAAAILFSFLSMGSTCATRNPIVVTDTLAGRWQVTDTTLRAVVCCMTIADGAISDWNDACGTDIFPVVDSQIARISDTQLIIQVAVQSPDELRVYTLNLTDGSNGELTGRITTRLGAGLPTVSDVAMTPVQVQSP